MPRISLLVVAAGLCLALGTACAGNDGPSEDELKEQITEQLERGGQGFSEADSACFADLLIEEAGVEALKDVDLSADAPPAELQDEIAAATTRAEQECELDDDGGD